MDNCLKERILICACYIQDWYSFGLLIKETTFSESESELHWLVFVHFRNNKLLKLIDLEFNMTLFQPESSLYFNLIFPSVKKALKFINSSLEKMLSKKSSLVNMQIKVFKNGCASVIFAIRKEY